MGEIISPNTCVFLCEVLSTKYNRYFFCFFFIKDLIFYINFIYDYKVNYIESISMLFIA